MRYLEWVVRKLPSMLSHFENWSWKSRNNFKKNLGLGKKGELKGNELSFSS